MNLPVENVKLQIKIISTGRKFEIVLKNKKKSTPVRKKSIFANQIHAG